MVYAPQAPVPVIGRVKAITASPAPPRRSRRHGKNRTTVIAPVIAPVIALPPPAPPVRKREELAAPTVVIPSAEDTGEFEEDGTSVLPARGQQRGRTQQPRGIRAWLRRAYRDTGSPQHAAVAEVLIALVGVSLVTTVLEFNEPATLRRHNLLMAVDLLVTACFAADYALNIAFSRNRAAYVFGPWGAIDLLAIIPSVHWLLVPQLGKTLKWLRFVRFLRVLKASKDLRRRFQLAQTEVPLSVFLPFEVILVLGTPPLLLIKDAALRELLLGALVTATVSLAARCWLVRSGLGPLAVIVLLVTLLTGALTALRLDDAGNALWAVLLVLAAVFVSLVSWLRIEAPNRVL